MKKSLIIISLLTAFISNTISQKNTPILTDSISQKTLLLKGNVKDNKGENIQFVNITLQLNNELRYGGVTDENGNYKIVIKPEDCFKIYNIKASFIGYHSKEINDVFLREESLNINFILIENKNVNEKQIITITKRTIDRDPQNANKTSFSSQEIQRSASGR